MVRRAPPSSTRPVFMKKTSLSDGAGGARTRPDLFFFRIPQNRGKGNIRKSCKETVNFFVFLSFLHKFMVSYRQQRKFSEFL